MILSFVRESYTIIFQIQKFVDTCLTADYPRLT